MSETWTPYELGILLHYYSRRDDHEHSPIFGTTIDKLIRCGLIRRVMIGEDRDRVWALTDCGEAFVKLGLCQTPIPVQVWQMPVEAE